MLPLQATNPASSRTGPRCWRSSGSLLASSEWGSWDVLGTLLCLSLPNGPPVRLLKRLLRGAFPGWEKGGSCPSDLSRQRKPTCMLPCLHLPVLSCDSVHVAVLAPGPQVLPHVSARAPPRGVGGSSVQLWCTQSRGMQGLGLMCWAPPPPPAHRPTWSSSLPVRRWGRFCRC